MFRSRKQNKRPTTLSEDHLKDALQHNRLSTVRKWLPTHASDIRSMPPSTFAALSSAKMVQLLIKHNALPLYTPDEADPAGSAGEECVAPWVLPVFRAESIQNALKHLDIPGATRFLAQYHHDESEQLPDKEVVAMLQAMLKACPAIIFDLRVPSIFGPHEQGSIVQLISMCHTKMMKLYQQLLAFPGLKHDQYSNLKGILSAAHNPDVIQYLVDHRLADELLRSHAFRIDESHSFTPENAEGLCHHLIRNGYPLEGVLQLLKNPKLGIHHSVNGKGQNLMHLILCSNTDPILRLKVFNRLLALGVQLPPDQLPHQLTTRSLSHFFKLGAFVRTHKEHLAYEGMLTKLVDLYPSFFVSTSVVEAACCCLPTVLVENLYDRVLATEALETYEPAYEDRDGSEALVSYCVENHLSKLLHALVIANYPLTVTHGISLDTHAYLRATLEDFSFLVDYGMQICPVSILIALKTQLTTVSKPLTVDQANILQYLHQKQLLPVDLVFDLGDEKSCVEDRLRMCGYSDLANSISGPLAAKPAAPVFMGSFQAYRQINPGLKVGKSDRSAERKVQNPETLRRCISYSY